MPVGLTVTIVPAVLVAIYDGAYSFSDDDQDLSAVYSAECRPCRSEVRGGPLVTDVSPNEDSSAASLFSGISLETDTVRIGE